MGFLDNLKNNLINEVLSSPKPRVLSSNVKLTIRPQNMGMSEYDQHDSIDVGEIDTFKKAKVIGVVKKFKPYGEKFETVITEDNGWDISFTCGKVDWNLAYFVYMNEVAMLGNIKETDSINRTAFENIMGRPVFTITEEIKLYNGKTEIWEYQDFVLLGYESNTNDDNQVIVESVTGFASRRVAIGDMNQDLELSKINSSVSKILLALKKSGKYGLQ